MFEAVRDGFLTLWRCVPDDQAAHDWLLAWFKDDLRLAFVSGSVTNPTKGNMGESIAVCVGKKLGLTDGRPYAVNAFQPLSAISRPDIDVLWIHFEGGSTQDSVTVQEVKTTGDPNLTIVRDLLADFNKLFGTDLRLTLQTRLAALSSLLRYTLNEPQLADRVLDIGGPSPERARGVRLLPTLVHESIGADPRTRMAGLQPALVAEGWPSEAVSAWSISIGDLDGRLARLARGAS